jgi:hypothetical protein
MNIYYISHIEKNCIFGFKCSRTSLVMEPIQLFLK